MYLRQGSDSLHGLAKQADNMQTPVLVLIVMLICPQSLWVATDCQLNNNVRDITIVSILSYERRGHWWISKGITVWIFYERSFF